MKARGFFNAVLATAFITSSVAAIAQAPASEIDAHIDGGQDRRGAGLPRHLRQSVLSDARCPAARAARRRC